LAGVTPGTYATRNEGGASEPVTPPEYRPWFGARHALDSLDVMTSRQNTQTMKPATAAKKLGVYLEATPPEFQEGVVSRDELNALQADPPEWLVELRRKGPHPRPVVAAKLGVSTSGLARGGITEPLTTEQIDGLKKELPDWLRRERATQAEVQREAVRLKEKNRAKQQAKRDEPPR
jgi:hypothetical protein